MGQAGFNQHDAKWVILENLLVTDEASERSLAANDIRLSMAMSPDGWVLSPVFTAVSLCAPVAGEHGWDGAVAPCPALFIPGQHLVGHCGDRVLASASGLF